ncbi:MAG: hypothetical protein ACREGG_04090 [Candidatus Saccharimonadales bacterium]
MKFKITAAFVVVLLGAAGFSAATVSPAKAYSMIVQTISGKADNPPLPTCSPAPYVFNPSTGKCELPQVTATLIGVKASASDVDSGKVTILAYVNAKGLSRTERSHARKMEIGAGTNVPCYWNSGIGANGQLFWFRDCRRITAYLVHGQWRKGPCGNFLRFSPPAHVVTGRVIMVRNFANVKVHLHAQATVAATSSNCPGTYASGSGTADVIVSFTVYVKSRGSITAQVSGAASAKASANATASVVCAPPTTSTVVTTTTTPGTTTTQTVTTPSPELRLEQIQEMYPNETQPVCADLKNAPSGGGKVVFSVSAGSAPKGSFADGSEPASSGNSRVCDTFQAPNATGTNQVSAELVVGGNDVADDSLGVEIIPQPSNP